MTKINGQHDRGFGTSFACPMAAGVAAMILSYYPQLTYKQVRKCIEQSATPIDLMVTRPGSGDKVPFRSLSKTGGIVNAYRAIKYAQMLGQKHP